MERTFTLCLFPDMDDDDVRLALFAEPHLSAHEIPPDEPIEWPEEEAAASAAVARLALWASRRAGGLRPAALETLHQLRGLVERVASRQRKGAVRP